MRSLKDVWRKTGACGLLPEEGSTGRKRFWYSALRKQGLGRRAKTRPAYAAGIRSWSSVLRRRCRRMASRKCCTTRSLLRPVGDSLAIGSPDGKGIYTVKGHASQSVAHQVADPNVPANSNSRETAFRKLASSESTFRKARRSQWVVATRSSKSICSSFKS